MTSDDLLLSLHYASTALAIVVPLFCWFILKIRQSRIFRIARAIRVINALFYVAATYYVFELFWKDLALGWPLTVLMPLIAYLLARRWAPKGFDLHNETSDSDVGSQLNAQDKQQVQ